MQGEEGLREYSAALGNTGVALESTGYLAPLGAPLSIASMGIDTGLDFKNEDSSTAWTNLMIRIAFFGVGKVIDELVPNVNNSPDEIVSSASLKSASKVAEDDAIESNKQKESK